MSDIITSVAHVASVATDKIFATQTTLAHDNQFVRLVKQTDVCQDHLTVLRASNDPFQIITGYLDSATDDQLVSVFTDLNTFFHALPHFHRLIKKKIVIHVEVPHGSDFSILTALRHSGFIFIQSFDAEDAQDMALISCYTALRSSIGVVNFFVNSSAEKSDLIPVSSIQSFILDLVKSEQNPEKTFSIDESFSYLHDILKRPLYSHFQTFGSRSEVAIVAFVPNLAEIVKSTDIFVIGIRVYAPFKSKKLLEITSDAKWIAVIEQLENQTTAWTPTVQDIISKAIELNEFKDERPSNIVSFRSLGPVSSKSFDEIHEILATGPPSRCITLNGERPILNGKTAAIDTTAQEMAKKLELAYVNVLRQLFDGHLSILNETGKSTTGSESNPEYGFGSYLAKQRNRREFIPEVQDVIKNAHFNPEIKSELITKLSEWALALQRTGRYSLEGSRRIQELLEKDSKNASHDLLSKKSIFNSDSSWLIGSDAWAYDLGNSGVHHVIASGKNLNMLVIDSEPYSEIVSKPGKLRKKDIGLYAMNFGNVYVASVAVYSSYTQLLQALLEADQFDGPSVVVAYLPYKSELDDALTVLQETKRAVETGYWPLYRYNPLLSDEEAFKLDSFQIRTELQQFLDRENRLTLLSKRNPVFSRGLASSYDSEVREQTKARAKSAYQKLLEGLSGPPLTILFASDGGTAETVGKRLATRAKGRGLKAIALAFDDYPLEDLGKDESMVFITSTAGQGEFPQNGRALWDVLKNNNGVDLAGVKVAVFGLGDSLYWPRKEDQIYYNKPAKDLSARLEVLGAKELVPLTLGDEQAADGYGTAYVDWEPHLWTSLGVEGVAAADEPPPITNEDIKIGSNYLRGTIADGLKDSSTGAISASDQQLTKFHGIYMQDDRDVRDQRKAEGLEPAYAFMVRVRLPGCVASPKQWLKIDELAEKRGNGTFKITTRGTFQLHGVIKENLKPAIRGINSSLIDTVAACGDVDRNVVCSAIPGHAQAHEELTSIANMISEHLLPQTTAYHEIWLEGKDDGDGAGYKEAINGREAGPKKRKTLVSGSTLVDHEPLYGPTYLPRKFKINIAVPPYNDADVYGHDIGLIAILNKDKSAVEGFNVLVGGGMGTTHNNRKTYPRTGSLFGYVHKSKIVDVCEKVMLVQRDHGDRKDRKHARVKYTIDDMGVEKYKVKTEELLGFKFEPARPFHFDSNIDTYGWTTDEKGLNHFTTFVENGRVEDTPELKFKTGLREIAKVLDSKGGEFRLTANQHILVSNISNEIRPTIEKLLSKYKLDNISFSGLRLSSSACVAFPTCGLAMAESERYLPVLVGKLEEALEEYGLRHDSIVMRMTGCPNGCARPWLAEVALVGKAYGAYNLMLGGGYHGERLNKLYKSSLKEDEILNILKPLFKRWSLEKYEGEHFGDFLIRTKVIAATTEGKKFWEHVAEDA